MRTVLLAAAWSGLGCLVGVAVWSALGATLAPLFFGPGVLDDSFAHWLPFFLGSAVWASVVGLLAFPIYTALLALWISLRHPRSGRSWQRESVIAAAILGTPLALLISWSFAEGGEVFGFDWRMAGRILAIALPSCWLAIGVPPRLLSGVRARLQSSAA